MQPGALAARQSGLLRQQRATVAMESDCGRFRASLSSGQAVLLGAERRGAGNIVAGFADSVAHGFLLKLSIACPSQRWSSSVHCIHGGLEWVATRLVLVYSKCCGTARDWVTATISARDSKYRFRTHILDNGRSGYAARPTAEIFSRLWVTGCIYHAVALRHMRRRQMRAMVALRTVWLVLHYTCAIRLAPSAGFAPCDSRGISPVHPHVHLISIETVYCSHFGMRMP